jgi:hypothetical protein
VLDQSVPIDFSRLVPRVTYCCRLEGLMIEWVDRRTHGDNSMPRTNEFDTRQSTSELIRRSTSNRCSIVYRSYSFAHSVSILLLCADTS